MERRRLGPDGPLVSAIGIGAMSFTDVDGATSEEAAHRVLTEALDLGIDHLDTSNIYGAGRSETVIGRFLSIQGKVASTLFKIATKAGISSDPATGERRFDNSRTHLEAELDHSLGRLGIEAVELFYVHRRDPDVAIEEVTETLQGFVRAGKIRRFGFSEIAPSSLRRAQAVHPVAAVQSEYSLWTRAPELGLVQACGETATALVTFSPLGRGMLTDAPPTPDAIARSRFLSTTPRFQEPNYTANITQIGRLRALAREFRTSAATLAIAWLLTRSPQVVPIPGTRSVPHLRELAAGAARRLGAEELARLEEALPVGWAHGDRYSAEQWQGPERYS